MNETINNLLARRSVIAVSSGVVGLGLGALAGYLYTKKQYKSLEESTEELIRSNEELEETQMQLDFERAEKDAEFNKAMEEAALVTSRMRQAGEELHKTVVNLNARSLVGDVDYASARELHPSNKKPNITVVTDGESTSVQPLVSRKAEAKNIFDNAGDEWDYKTEIENRDRSQPYIIHVDEYLNDEMGWDSQSTLTWYEGDQILCDSRNVPIYNHNDMVGELKFGHGSNDANVVYIRNEKLQSEYEVLRDSESYEDVVLGDRMEQMQQEDELRHSMSRKFRDD